MAGDRDLAVAFAAAWAGTDRGYRSGWEVTAATGVRGLRLLNESGAFDRFLLTEANPEAARVLVENARRFEGAVAAGADGKCRPEGLAFDYVDIDPYGTPAPFVPTALSALRPGGVLAVTATDMMVLAGAQPAACARRYGASPIRGRLGPEGGLRILLAYLAREARGVGRAVRPLLAYTRDHHVRAYVEVRVSESASAADPVGTIDPSTWTGPSVGEGGPYGPLWLGPVFDPGVVSTLRVPAAAARPTETAHFVAKLQAEAGVDQPFYYEANRLAAQLRLPYPPALSALLDGLRANGFRAARTHARPEGFRTDAPRTQVEALARTIAGRAPGPA